MIRQSTPRRPLGLVRTVAILATASLVAVAVSAQVPTTLSYQGRLLTQDPDPTPATGSVDIEFSIWSAVTDGTELWSESWTDVPLSHGLFDVLLGSNGSPLTPAVFTGSGPFFLQLTLDGEPLLPRRAIGSLPFAMVDEPTNELQDLEFVGDELSLSGSSAGVDLSIYTDDLFTTIAGNSGSTTADTLDDTFALVGVGTVATAVSGDTLTVIGVGDGLGPHVATQNLDLSTFKLVGSNGSTGLSIAADGTVRFDGSAAGLEINDPAPEDPVRISSLFVGFDARSLSVSGRYAYVVDDDSGDVMVVDLSDPRNTAQVGVLTIEAPRDIFVAGRYALVIDNGSASDDLKILDVSNPSAPSLTGRVQIAPRIIFQAVFGAGPYAYALASRILRVIDVSDPNAPVIVGVLGPSGNPVALFVEGRYAYMADNSLQALQVVDVSDPSAPTLVGSLGIGPSPAAVFVSGRYAYVVDRSSEDLKIIDISDPSAPTLVGSLGVGSDPRSLFVSGRYAYVLDFRDEDLRVIDVGDPSAPVQVAQGFTQFGAVGVVVSGGYAYTLEGLEVSDLLGPNLGSVNAHSLEAGSLQVRESLTVQGHLTVNTSVTVGAGGVFSDGNVGLSGTLILANDIAPTSSPADLAQLYAADEADSSELRVRDEAGNITTLSPHNFSLVGAPSEPLAWSFFSENDHGRINVDMLRTVRLMEQMSGQKLVHSTAIPSDAPAEVDTPGSLYAQVNTLRQQNEQLRKQREVLRTESQTLQALLCLDYPQEAFCTHRANR